MTTARRFSEVNSCQGKKRYGKHHAARAAKYLREKGENVHVYGCRFCNWYHIGHSDRVK